MQAILDLWRAAKFRPILISMLLFPAGCVSLEGVEPVTVPAYVVQANYRLWNAATCKCNYPALLVYSLDPASSHDDMRRLAKLTFDLKGVKVAHPGQQFLSDVVTDESYYGDVHTRVPESVGYGSETFIAGMMIDRKRLSKGYLSNPELWLTVWAVDGKPRKVELKSD